MALFIRALSRLARLVHCRLTRNGRARWQRVRTDVGARIRATRLQKGLTQEALALEAGLSRNVLIEVEHGRIGLLYERLFDIAAVLGVSVSELVGSA